MVFAREPISIAGETRLLRHHQSFRPHERLRTSREYQRVRREGRRIRTRHFAVHFATNGLPYHRLGLVVQKRFWKAVKRNRLKRCLREFFRLNKHRIPGPYKDIVVIPRPGAERLTTQQIGYEILTALKQLNGRTS